MHRARSARFNSALSLSLTLLAAAAGKAQAPDPATVEIKTTQLAPALWMLEGSGGNIGVSAGDDGVFLIDDQFAPLVPKIKAAIARLSKKPVRFVFNTHWHGDHTGGNEPLSGEGALIVAHDNVRKRMSVEQVFELRNITIPPSPAAALPVGHFRTSSAFT